MHNVNSCWFQVCLGGTRKLAKVGNFLKMDRVEYRAVIRFLLLEGENATNIHKRLSNVYGKSSPSYSIVASWVSEFKRGRKDLNDEPRPGRPVSQSAAENVDKVHQLVLENREISIECIVQETGLSTGTVHTILHEHLSMSKVCARWVPKMLTPDMKATRVNTSSVLLSRYNVNPEIFRSRVVTGDETWVYYYTPIQIRIHGMEACRLSQDKEIQGFQNNQERHGHSILGYRWSDSHRLFTQRYHNEWTILCWFARPVEGVDQRETPRQNQTGCTAAAR